MIDSAFRKAVIDKNGWKLLTVKRVLPSSLQTDRGLTVGETSEYVAAKLLRVGKAEEVREEFGDDGESFISLFASIIEKGYDPTCLAVMDENGIVRDGVKRLAIILALFGDNPVPIAVYGQADDRKSVLAVILHHNKPENADRLFEQLSGSFDVELIDSGSDYDKIPVCTTLHMPNIYWTGAWNLCMERYAEYDAVWMVGCDITLENDPAEYRKAIKESLPFGCWSPCINGRAHPFMLAQNYTDKQPREVRNVEGMAMAVSGELMRKVGKLEVNSPIGFGQDYWLCYRARQAGLKNVIDGRVSVRHPAEIGYDEREAHDQMEKAFSAKYGADFRRTIFEYNETFNGNLSSAVFVPSPEPEPQPVKEVVKQPVIVELNTPTVTDDRPYTIVTVDNGWTISDFARITAKVPNARRIVMRKGMSPLFGYEGVEVVEYSPNLEEFARIADVAFFPKLGTMNRDEYRALLRLGVPTVVHVGSHEGLIEHEKTGFVFGDENWAIHWLSYLRSNPGVRKAVSKACRKKLPGDDGFIAKVTVITPTYNRDPKTVAHCIDCMRMQTVDNWEQLICSDGNSEQHIMELVNRIGDPRIQYHHTSLPKKEGDFGNTVRAEMLKRAKGEFVLFFDDDNLILPNYLERMLAEVEKAKVDFAVCRAMHFGPLNEQVLGKPPRVITGSPVKLYHVDPLQVLVKRTAMQDIGWNTTVGYLSDGVTLEKLGQKYKHVEVPEVLAIHM